MPLSKFSSKYKFTGRRRKPEKRRLSRDDSPDSKENRQQISKSDEVTEVKRNTARSKSTLTTNNTANIGNITDNNEQNVPLESASEKKMSHFKKINDDMGQNDDICGYRIVSTDFIKSLVSGLNCPNCNDKDTLKLSESKFRGLASTINVYCTTCECDINSVATSPKTDEKWGSSIVNRRAVLAMKEMGCGKSDLDKLSKVMGFPSSLEKEAFAKHLKALTEASVSVAQEHMLDVSKIVHNAYNESDPSQVDNEIKNIGVSCDGTWHKRGFTSHYGIVAIVDLLTNLIIDYEVMCNYCSKCTKNKMDKDSQEYLDWYEAHKDLCEINHAGSSKSMETAAAVILYKRSIERYKLRYTTLLNDGDSSAYNELQSLNSGIGPYGLAFKVSNEDCINHISKRVKNNLDTVIQKTKAQGTPIDGKGKLTKVRVRAMQNYYGRAIKDNKNDLKSMTQATWAVFFHYIDDGKPHHSHCAGGINSWCWYNRQKAAGIANPVRGEHSAPLPLSVMEKIKPVFARLYNSELLKRCLRGATQNCNESFNSVIWSRAPKHRNASLASINNAVARGVLDFNKGASGIVDVMRKASISPGPNVDRYCASRDKERVRKSRVQGSVRFKRIRKEKELAKLKLAMARERSEGATYHAGMS